MNIYPLKIRSLVICFEISCLLLLTFLIFFLDYKAIAILIKALTNLSLSLTVCRHKTTE